MATRLLALAATALTLALVGCEPSIPDATLLCGTAAVGSENCPPGFVCCPAPEREGFDGVCVRDACDGGIADAGRGDGGQTDDGGGPDAGSSDAGMADAGAPPAPLSVAAGGLHTCALWSDGAIYCWGRNEDGRLGNGETRADRGETIPVAVVSAPAGVLQIAAGGQHTCARTADAVFCWGSHVHGQLGDGSSSTLRDEPVRVALPTGATPVDLAVGEQHSCVATAAGEVLCWGRNNEEQLGLPRNLAPNPTPQRVMGVSGATEVAAGVGHTCAIATDGAVECWGRNQSGELGRGTTSAGDPAPAPVVGVRGASALAAGSRHACAIVSGEALCWGAGGNGQLGQGLEASEPMPVSVGALPGPAARIAGGGTIFVGHTCVAGPELPVHCWGSRLSGQVGDGVWLANASSPELTIMLSGTPTSLSTGGEHSCAILDGAVYCWGKNNEGQLGDATTDTTNRPVRTADPR